MGTDARGTGGAVPGRSEPHVVDVAVRWSDQDAYGHVNHARVVTLFEEARSGLLFDAAARAGVGAFEAGLLVAALEVRYHRPVPWRPAGVRVELSTHDVRAASFRVTHRLWLDPDDARPAVIGDTQLVPYDLDTERPRRLSPDERAFVECYRDR